MPRETFLLLIFQVSAPFSVPASKVEVLSATPLISIIAVFSSAGQGGTSSPTLWPRHLCLSQGFCGGDAGRLMPVAKGQRANWPIPQGCATQKGCVPWPPLSHVLFSGANGEKASVWFSLDEVFSSNSTSPTWGSSIPIPRSWQRDAFRMQHYPSSLLLKSNSLKLLLIIIDSFLEASCSS